MNTKEQILAKRHMRLVASSGVSLSIDVPGGLVSLAAPSATDATLTGAKASALARAATAGLPVLEGFVITTEATGTIVAAGHVTKLPPDDLAALRVAWRLLSHDGTRRLVVRSSSTAEDGDDSSMAGMFSSVLDVGSWDAFLVAIDRVIGSRKVIDLNALDVTPAPIAVLVQPQLDAVAGGIMFGIDPVTGNPKHLTVVATDDGPDALVSGRVEGQHYLMTHSGRLIDGPPARDAVLGPRSRRQLAQLAARAADRFGGPQDIEWGIDVNGRLYLFQSRPVTAVGAKATGPIMGPGPVAETFPDPLSMLEIDLWVTPLRAAIIEALRLTGAASGKRLKSSEVVTTVGGRVAADLELFGIAPTRKTLWQRIDPLPPARRLAAAWRVGRLRAALPTIGAAIAEKVDANLSHIPQLDELSDEELVTVLKRAQRTLMSLHGFEVLAGLMSDEEDQGGSGAAIALRALAIANSEGFAAAQVVAEHPEVLALVPPAIGGSVELPATTSMELSCQPPNRNLGPREALRLRIRWVQELSARAAAQLGSRLHALGLIESAGSIALLDLAELEAATASGRVPTDLRDRVRPASPPLPAAFRLTATGVPVPVSTQTMDGVGAGGGRGMGTVHHGGAPRPGDVLIVRTLDPSLAPLLPSLGGLVAETGSALSHLAILAREFGVPTVVAFPDARERFPEGSVVIVDGSTGEVSAAEGAAEVTVE